MFFSKTFVSLIAFLLVTVLCKANIDYLSLAKVCHQNLQDACFGVYIKSRWILVSSRCKHVGYKNTEIVVDDFHGDCRSGKTSKILRIYELNQEKNLLLLKIDAPIEITVTSNLLENKFGQDSCVTYCLQGRNSTCGKEINPIPIRTLVCQERFKNNVCLKVDNNTIIDNLDGSPMLCNGTMVGYVHLLSTKDLLTLANLSEFHNEINEIIKTDAKMAPLIQNSNDGIEKLEAADNKSSLKYLDIPPKLKSNIKYSNPHRRHDWLLPQKKQSSMQMEKVLNEMRAKMANIVDAKLISFKGTGRKVARTVIKKINGFIDIAEGKLRNIMNGNSKKARKITTEEVTADEEDDNETEGSYERKRKRKRSTKKSKRKAESKDQGADN